MSTWGEFDVTQFQQLAKVFKKAIDERVIERWIREFLLEMAYRAERKIKKRTPVDTGELRRNWTVGTVQKHGDKYFVEIFNNTEYAPFVEFGHRSGVGLTKWTDGRFMMTISMKEMEKELPKFLERKQMELLNQIFNGRG